MNYTHTTLIFLGAWLLLFAAWVAWLVNTL